VDARGASPRCATPRKLDTGLDPSLGLAFLGWFLRTFGGVRRLAQVALLPLAVADQVPTDLYYSAGAAFCSEVTI